MLNRDNVSAGAAPWVVLCLLATAAPASAGAALPQRTTFGDIIDGARLLKPGAAVQIRSRAAAIELLLDQRSYPGTCATPLLIALSQSRARLGNEGAALLRRLGPLPGAFESAHATLQDSDSGAFRLGFSTRPGDPAALDPEDGDLDGLPDQARTILDRLDEARSEVLATFARSATPATRPDGEEPVHRVEIAELPGRLGGYVWRQGGESLLVLDKGSILSTTGDAILRHQVAHLLQIGLTPDESPWWYEAHATWVEDPSGATASRRRGPVVDYLDSAPMGFEPFALRALEGSFLWPHYLTWSGGPPAVMGAAWEEMADFPGNNTIQAMGRALESLGGTTLPEEVRSFRIWNVFLGVLDDGNHYPFAADLESPLVADGPGSPGSLAGGGTIAPLGAASLRLDAGLSPGGWIMDFQADPLAGWDVSLLTIPAYMGGRPGLAVMDVEEGVGRAAVPWGDLGGIVVVVQNLGGPPADGTAADHGSFSFEAAYDPLVPFDLMSFSATDEGEGTVALRWHTEREMSMLGWTLYRSRDPLTGFQPIQSILIPAIGGEEAASYMILDQNLPAGHKFYYLLEGITEQGFREVAYPVSVRLLKVR